MHLFREKSHKTLTLPTFHLYSASPIYYDLRRQGLTVRSPIDCCIAQAALENDLLLIHNDRDFETIAQVRSLQNLRFQP
ncbi:hypothetical protein MICCA_2460012 [Microcystis aeruginosa PCC 9432]|uniref:PIN domain-containing protein n=1 Tax=Microcystis aeruginosa PCC 9432 TaxID=1160280 RepID=A0A822LCU3_MICAE|nr:hypothetical protein MICCA_2460012 [Microcystis aeruginosa PCC 9432]